MTDLVHNERVKLLAGTLNTTGIASMVTGAVAPIAGAVYGVSTGKPSVAWLSVVFAWVLVGVVLHVIGQVISGRLRDD